MPAKITVVFYTTYGHNHAMAEIAAEAAREAGAEVRLRQVRETAPAEVVEAQQAWKAQQERMTDIPTASADDMEWADGYLFSSPTRFGGAASQMRSFIDTLGPLWQKGALADKTFTAMTSAQNVHGGQETTLHTLYVTAMHWGCVLVPPGYTGDSVFASGGNPYGASVTATGPDVDAETAEAIRHQARRLVRFTDKLA
ncbi:NAD(P)H:quinone oxidoreductase [Rubrivirga sp. IMCC45206]|uniref:NAD(P)H:quinone oxidoreductase n=1 Tax=Rubrivirga sp. IMCC45206 TaxID=3391614 RepID=UPI0039902AB5